MQTYKKALAQNLRIGDKFFAFTTENKKIFGIRCNPYPENAGSVCFYYTDFETGHIKFLMENDEVLRVIEVEEESCQDSSDVL